MKYFITPEPQRMDPCEFWEYLQQFLPCEPTPTIQEPVPTPTEPITYEPPVMTQPTPVHGFEPVQPSLDRVYYYHGDHLGSSTYVTDDNGRPVAYYDYLPFGEVAVEHNQTTNFNNGYKFNAKELDEATGMSYYGARYYDPRISLFVSVDPLAEETFEPYSYVGNNPIMFTDPTGMYREGVENECDSCKNESDWNAYRDQAKNTASMIGEDFDMVSMGVGDRMKVGYNEEGRQIYFLDGEKMDLRQYDSRLLVAASFINDAALIEAPIMLLKNSGKILSTLFSKTKNIKPKSSELFSDTVRESFLRHAFSNNRHTDLGMSNQEITNKAMSLIEKNRTLLKEGDNTLIGKVNGIEKSFKAYMKNEKVISINMYPGISNRSIGTVINYGEITWK